MPTAFVLDLQPGAHAARPQFPAQYAHGLFYHLLAAIDPGLSATIHAAKRVPFTLGVEVGRGALGLRVALLDDDLFQPLLRVVLHQSLDGLTLGQDRYRVARVLATPEGHPRAGRATWAEVHAAPPARGLHLRFLTPTVFATSRPDGRRSYTPLPEPRLVLGGLLSSLQAFSPLPYSTAEVEYLVPLLGDHCAVTRLQLRSDTYWAGRHPYTGFCGETEFRYADDLAEVRRLLGQLAALAPYCGVGTKTPYGMGQVDVLRTF